MHPSIQQLILDCKAKTTPGRLEHVDYLLSCNGFYDPCHDEIYINFTLDGFKQAEAALHELIHWSGAKHRLNREIVQIPKSHFNSYETNTEEATAQFGMLLLMRRLGIWEKEAQVALCKYLADLEMYDSDIAIKNAEKAVDYIFELCETEQIGKVG